MEGLKNFIEVIKNKDAVEFFIFAGVLASFIILSSLFAKIIMKCFKIKPEKLEKNSKIYGIIKFIWIITGLYIAIVIFSLPEQWMYMVRKIYKLIMIYSITRLSAQLVMPSTKFFEKFRDDKDSKNEHTIHFGIKFFRAIIYVIGAFIFIAELGYDLSGLITGLGIGSVVIALAAQDLAKNMFGGFAILTDKTFVIGDTIEVNGTFGTVEDISFRTTRIRKLDDTIATVPNSKLADSEIINWTKLKKRRIDCELKLGFDITQKQINDLIKKIGFELQKNKDIIKDSIRIYFSDIDHDGYKISLYAYTNIVDYDEYLEFINTVNSSIVSLLEKEDIDLVYPTQNVKLK